MSDEQKRSEIALVLRLAGLSAPPERLDRLAAGFESTRSVVNIFAALNLADSPPATRFRPPGPR
jgi:hypothetical protein